MQGLMMMGVAMIFLAVGFIIYPIVLDGTDTINAWATADYDAGPPVVGYNTASFTGLTPVVGITPLIVLLGFIVAGAIQGFMGVKMIKGGVGKMDIGGLMMLGIGLIFIAVALIIFPVVLDGVATALAAAALGTYTGLTAILGVTPLIVLVAFLVGGVISGFFGVKKQFGAMSD